MELQRRVARPFARITLLIENRPASNVLTDPREQNPSYLAVETCKDEKTAVLSLFVRLPGEHETGLPALGRTGLCLGSTLTRVNSSKKPKIGGKKREEEEQRERGSSGGHVTTSEDTLQVRSVGRGRLRLQSPSAVTV